MPAERLYYKDAYLRNFTALVIGRSDLDGRPAVALDCSAFYPEGGGQPADRGTLNGVPVVDVQFRDGEIWHVLEPGAAADTLQPGTTVAGNIDWERRYDHMQQHLGQHLLTAAFIATSGLPTTSFHLGASSATIDLETPALNEAQVHAAEECANQIIWEDRPLSARFVTREELARLPLRKAPSVDGPIRVVSVPDFDHSPCGGTHPRSTGGVGLIAVRGWWRQKGRMRVEFICGGRVLRDYRRLNGIATRAATSLSVGLDELEEALARLRAANDAQRKELEYVQSRLRDLEVREMLASARVHGSARVVCRVLDDARTDAARALAQQIAAQPGGIALLGVGAERASLLVACAPDTGIDARTVLAAGLPLVHGRGGGSPTFAQGGGPHQKGLQAALDAMFAQIVGTERNP